METKAKILNLSPAEYHRDPCETPSLSASIACKLVMEAPIKAWLAHPRLGAKPTEPSRAMQFGTVCHHKFSGVETNIAVIDAADYRTKDAREQRDSALAKNQTPILACELPEAEAIAAAARRFCGGAGIKLAGQWEQVILWEEDGIKCRCMMDHLSLGNYLHLNDPSYILDLKTSTNANPDDLGKKIVDEGYDIQAAAYIKAAEAVAPHLVGHIPFYFLFVETTEPYLCSIVRPSEGLIQLGMARWERAKALWRECLETKSWPGYPSKPVTVFPAPYQLQKEMQYGTEITLP